MYIYDNLLNKKDARVDENKTKKDVRVDEVVSFDMSKRPGRAGLISNYKVHTSFKNKIKSTPRVQQNRIKN